MIPIQILEKELKQALERCTYLSSEIEDGEESLEYARKDLAFNKNKVAELKAAIEKLKATEL